jgi:hypothetical protein
LFQTCNEEIACIAEKTLKILWLGDGREKNENFSKENEL